MTIWSRRLLRYAWPEWRALLVILLLAVAVSSVEALKPWPLKLLVDGVLSGQPTAAIDWIGRLPGAGTARGLTAWLTGLTVVLFLLSAAFRMLQSYIQTGAGTRMMYQLGGDLFEHIQRLSLRFHVRHKTGDLIQRISVDSRAIRDLLVSVCLPLLTSSVTMAIMFAVMWRLHATLTLIALGVVPILLLAIWTFAKQMEDRSYAQSELQGRMMGAAEQTLAAIPMVQAFGREPAQDQVFGELTAQTGRAYFRTTVSQLRFRIASATATALGTAAIVIVGGQNVLDGRLSVGSLLVFLSYLAALYDPLTSIAYATAGYASAAAGARRVLQIVDVHDRIEEKPNAIELDAHAAGAPSIRFEDVSFGYDPATPVLQNVTLTIAAGERVALVGASGSGKSTLIALMLRLFDPSGGRILLNGHDLRDLRVASLRSQIAVVLQDPYLFPVSVADNLAFGRPGATRHEIVDAAVAAQADEFIARLPNGYDTVIGERGVTLSGGQRQRLSIARALLKNAPVVLLDEPTAALDVATEAALMGAIETLVKGRTCVIVAHRLSTIRSARRIFVLDQGRLLECGSEAELLAAGGAYRRLHLLQDGA